MLTSRWMRGPLREAAGEGEGSSKQLTEEDVGNIVNRAVTSQLSRVLPKAISEGLGALKLDELVYKKLEEFKPKAPETVDDKAPRLSAGDKELQKQLEKLQTQTQSLADKLEASEKRSKQLEEERDNEAKARRFESGRQQLRNLLQPKANEHLLDVWVDQLSQVQKRLAVSDDGTVTLRVRRAPYKGAPLEEQDLPLSEAVDFMLTTDEAKPFIPAPKAAASTGLRGPGLGSGSGQMPVGGTDAASKTMRQLSELGLSAEDL